MTDFAVSADPAASLDEPATVELERATGGGADKSARRRAAISDAVLVILLYLASILLALGLSAALVAATGGSATSVYNALLDGSIRSPGAWGLTLSTTSALLIVALFAAGQFVVLVLWMSLSIAGMGLLAIGTSLFIVMITSLFSATALGLSAH